MSKRIYKAIFERFIQPADNFGTALGEWQEVAREWVSLTPQTIGKEFVDAAQVKGTTPSITYCNWSRTMAGVDIACRMKIAKLDVVNEQEPDDDANFRIFGIENIVNVREQNRELQLMVLEKG